jgi:hypothetical protein
MKLTVVDALHSTQAPVLLDIDERTVVQATRTARLPILAGPLALMPDAHVGIGAAGGSVIATDGALVPSAVGVDVGVFVTVGVDVGVRVIVGVDVRVLVGVVERVDMGSVGQGDLGVVGGRVGTQCVLCAELIVQSKTSAALLTLMMTAMGVIWLPSTRPVASSTSCANTRVGRAPSATVPL